MEVTRVQDGAMGKRESLKYTQHMDCYLMGMDSVCISNNQVSKMEVVEKGLRDQ